MYIKGRKIRVYKFSQKKFARINFRKERVVGFGASAAVLPLKELVFFLEKVKNEPT